MDRPFRIPSTKDLVKRDLNKTLLQKNALNDLKMVFREAGAKFMSKMDKPGNVTHPWEDFDLEHLKDRFYQETEEFCQNEDPEELLDIIVMAAILRLSYKVNGQGELLAPSKEAI
jgi:predicted house-cleaning noncanonical NTP pyrophosphatase (MazG superfamily)